VASEKITRRTVLGARNHSTKGPSATVTDISAENVKNGGKQGTSVRVIRELKELEQYVPAWEDLARAAIEPNAFYEPWMLLPAIKAFGEGRQVFFLLVETVDPARPLGPPLLSAVFPLEVNSKFNGLGKSLPFRTLSFWKHERCYLCTPLLRSRYARESLTAFFEWVGTEAHGCSLLELDFIAGDGPVYHLLIDYINEFRKLNYVTNFTRAFFRQAADPATYLRDAISGVRRKEMKRLERRLAETGRLEYLMLNQESDVAAWIDEFLRVEATGWKGQAGRATASNELEREFFVTVATEAFRRGQLMMLSLHYDGRSIAHKCNFLAGDGSFAYKIAFDEQYARYSPGVLLEVENINRLHERAETHWMDSCADPDRFMINQLWPARRTISTVLIGTGKAPGDLVVAAIPMLRWFIRKLVWLRRNLVRVTSIGRNQNLPGVQS